MPDRLQHRRSVVLGEMQIEHDHTGFIMGARRPLQCYEFNGCPTIAKYLQDVRFTQLIESMPQKKNIRWIVFDYENLGWTKRFSGQAFPPSVVSLISSTESVMQTPAGCYTFVRL